jgi:hypothetical protein
VNRALAAVVAAYFGFTLTDGALRMLVVLHFAQRGFPPLAIALLFVGYELCGVVTNLFGGWLAARLGLRPSLLLGLALQTLGLGMLVLPDAYLTPLWVLLAQALSGIAKDLNKTAAKSALRVATATPGDRLFRLAAWVTGSKNALKGIGFLAGGLLLWLVGFQAALAGLVVFTAALLAWSSFALAADLGRASYRPKLRDLLSPSRGINWLSGARFFLFGSRDIWFAVALPVCLQEEFGWSPVAVGTFMACWVIGYGVVQGLTPMLGAAGHAHRGVGGWTFGLAAVLAGIGALLQGGVHAEASLVGGLLLFGAVFAVTSALHSYLVLAYADDDGVSLDVGFYYMANAGGRLVGTLLSGLLYQWAGLLGCVVAALVSAVLAALPTLRLPAPSDAALLRASRVEPGD